MGAERRPIFSKVSPQNLAGLCGAAGRSPMLTFDAKAARLPDVKLLEA